MQTIVVLASANFVLATVLAYMLAIALGALAGYRLASRIVAPAQNIGAWGGAVVGFVLAVSVHSFCYLLTIGLIFLILAVCITRTVVHSQRLISKMVTTTGTRQVNRQIVSTL